MDFRGVVGHFGLLFKGRVRMFLVMRGGGRGKGEDLSLPRLDAVFPGLFPELVHDFHVLFRRSIPLVMRRQVIHSKHFR
jgi:hypothetical protein